MVTQQIESAMSGKILVGRKQERPQEPTINVEKQGEKIVAIKIACRCGEEIVVNCTYPESA